MPTKGWGTGLLIAVLAFSGMNVQAAARHQYRVPLHAMAAAPGLAFEESNIALKTTAGQTISKLVQLRNTGNVSLSNVTLSLESSKDSVLLLDGCSNISLSVSASCFSSIQVTEGEAGASSARLLAKATSVTKTGAGTNVSANAVITLTVASDTASAKVTSVVATPATLVADGVSETLAQATVYDAYGNVAGAGIPITWSASAGSLVATTSTTNENGIATTRLTSGTKAGLAALTAKAPSTSPAETAVLLVGNTATAATSTITASPASVPANGSSASTLSTVVRDANGNSLGAGISVYWTATSGMLAAPVTLTDEFGIATVSLTSPVNAGTATISAKTLSAPASSTWVAFTPDSSTATVVSLTSSQASLAATGSATALLTATLKDGKGNLLGQGLPVSWSTNLGVLTSATSMTDASGTATMTLTSGTTLGTATVSAGVPKNATQRSVNVTFVPDTATAQVTGISVSNASLTSGNSTNVVATVRDGYGHALDGYPVYFSTTLGSITSPVTSVGGLATSSTTSASSGSATVRAYTSQQGVNNAAVTTVTYTSACQTFFDEGNWSFVLRVNPGYSSGVWTTPVDYGGQLVLNGEWGPVIPPNGYADWRGYRYYLGTLQDYLYFEPEDPPKEAWSYIRCPL